MKVKFLFAAICALPLLAGAGVRVDLNGLQDGIKLRKTPAIFSFRKGTGSREISRTAISI